MTLPIPRLGGREIWPPFTIPSGVITTTPDLVRRIAAEVPLGLITAKSVGIAARDGYPEPVFSQYSRDSLSTAIGLSNPGYEAWIEEMRHVYPLDGKFLLVSVFGAALEEFVTVAKAVSPYCDGIELNFCCPHSLEYGAALARQEQLTVEITRAVRKATSRTLVAKLTPDGPEIGGWSRHLVDAGAEAIAAIGPTKAVTVTDPHTGRAVLSYGSGGLSGPAILETGIERVAAIRRAVDVPVIAGGGIRGADDVRRYREAGADIFAVGTSLASMDTPTLRDYFRRLLEDIERGTDRASGIAFNRRILDYRPAAVVSVSRHGDTAVLQLDISLSAEPGQFIFAWLPGIGEKPYGIAGADPLLLGVRRAGKVSNALCALQPGDEVMIRGPFGKPFPILPSPVLVAGGCGAVPLRLLAERAGNALVILGAKTADDLLFREDFARYGELILATEDDTTGTAGTVLDALRDVLSKRRFDGATFYNCGPERMMAAAMALESRHVPGERIFAATERHTVCGVGLCGKCALDGYRSCVDGPVFSYAQLSEGEAFGKWKRGPSGKREPITGAPDATECRQ